MKTLHFWKLTGSASVVRWKYKAVQDLRFWQWSCCCFCCCYCCCCCKETNATNRRSLRSWQCLSETIKFPVFYAINSFITIFTTGHQWILSWANWVICIITLSFNIHFNNILSSTSSYGPFLHVFPINCCIHSQPTILITESAYLNAAKVLNM